MLAAAGSVYSYLERRGVEDPTASLIVEADGKSYTHAECLGLLRTWIGWFEDESRRRLVRVAGLLPNSAVAHLVRVAAAEAGVVCISLNPMLRGKVLRDALERSRVTDILIPEGESLQTFGLDGLIGGTGTAFALHPCGPNGIAFSAATGSIPAAEPEPQPRPCHTLLYTSGTSGPAKPVEIPAELMLSYGRLMFGGEGRTWQSGGYYNPWHPAHVLGAVALETALLHGLNLVLREKFDMGMFWRDIVQHDCRLVVLISVANLVYARRTMAPSANPLEVVGVSPVLSNYQEFESAFGVDVVNIYGSTELGIVLTASAPQDRHFVGSPNEGFRCGVIPSKLAPETDALYGGTTVGELIVQPLGTRTKYDIPGEQGGWHGDWFHTGDLVSERDGLYRFIGRAHDSIRRRGRNISAHDLEEQVRAVPGVGECICVSYPGLDLAGNPSSYEDEIRLFVLPNDREAVNPADLLEALRGRLPGFMLPRYIDMVNQLPQTASGKLSRRTLRELPLTAHTFDRKNGSPASGA